MPRHAPGHLLLLLIVLVALIALAAGMARQFVSPELAAHYRERRLGDGDFVGQNLDCVLIAFAPRIAVLPT